MTRLGLLGTLAAVATLVLGPTAASAAMQTSSGTDFWLAYMTPPPQQFSDAYAAQVLITGTQAASGVVTVAGLHFEQAFTVTQGAVSVVDLPPAVALTPSSVQALAVHVTADHDIDVTGLSHQPHTQDSWLALPAGALGTDHLIMGMMPSANDPDHLSATEFAIAASQDATTVTITPSSDAAGPHAAHVPFTARRPTRAA